MVAEQPTSAPLTGEDKNALDAALAAGDEIRGLLSRAKAAGIDVTEPEAELNKQLARARSIRQAFFPNE